MKRGDVFWADAGGAFGRRPVLVVTRDAAIAHLSNVVVATITSRVRDIRSEISLGSAEGLEVRSVANCDNVLTIPKDRFDAEPVGSLHRTRMRELDRALRYALGIRY